MTCQDASLFRNGSAWGQPSMHYIIFGWHKREQRMAQSQRPDGDLVYDVMNLAGNSSSQCQHFRLDHNTASGSTKSTSCCINITARTLQHPNESKYMHVQYTNPYTDRMKSYLFSKVTYLPFTLITDCYPF
jgi:hypothetical protein